jgi:IS5 family transposase
MVSIIGVGLGRNQLITGFGMHHHTIRRRATRGRGVRTTAGSVVKHIGHALVDKLAGVIAGSGYKLAGGRHHVKHHIRKPRSTLGMGRRRIHHRRIIF